MEENNEKIQEQNKVETLEMEVMDFVYKLPYWSKYLATKILSGDSISDMDIDNSWSYLLEDLGIKDKTIRDEIIDPKKYDSLNDFELDLRLLKLENVEGVNALTENQTIEFNPQMTIIYGANGSGKSGYVRLLKNAFYSNLDSTCNLLI